MKRIILDYIQEDDLYFPLKNKNGEIVGRKKYETFNIISEKNQDIEYIKGEEVWEYLRINSDKSIWNREEEIAVCLFGEELYRQVNEMHNNREVYIGLRNFNITDLMDNLKFYTIANARCVFIYDNTTKWKERYNFFLSKDMEKEYLPLPEIKIRTTFNKIKESFDIFNNDDSKYIGFDYETTNLPEWTSFKIIGFGLATNNQTHYIDTRELTDEEYVEFDKLFKDFCNKNYRRMWVYNVNFEQIATYRELQEWYNFQDLMVYVKVFNLGYATLKKFVPMTLTYVKSWDDEMDFLFEKIDEYFYTYKNIYELKNSGLDIDPRIRLDEKWYSDNLYGLIDAKTMGYYCGLDSYWTMKAVEEIKNTTGDYFDKAYNGIKTNYYLASTIFASGIKLNEQLRRKYEDIYTIINMNSSILMSYAYYKKLYQELEKLCKDKIVIGFDGICNELIVKDYNAYALNKLREYLDENGQFKLQQFRTENSWVSLKMVKDLKSITNRNISRKTKIINQIAEYYKNIYDEKVDEFIKQRDELLNNNYFKNLFTKCVNKYILSFNYEKSVFYKIYKDKTNEQIIEMMMGEWLLKKCSFWEMQDYNDNILDKNGSTDCIFDYFNSSYGLISLLNVHENTEYVFYNTVQYKNKIKQILDYYENLNNFNLLDFSFKENPYQLNVGNDVDNKEYYITMFANVEKFRNRIFGWMIENTEYQPNKTKRLEEYSIEDIRGEKTDEELMEIFAVCSILHGDSVKQLSTYLKGFIYEQSKMFTKFDKNFMTTWDKPEYSDDYLVIKPRINVCGVTTKRSSSGFHTTPPECDFMTIFEPESEDRWFVYSDASAAEVKTAIYMSGDGGMIAAVESGEDMYNTIGKLIEGEDKYDPIRRTRYKTILLGTIYGMGEETSAERLGIPVNDVKKMNQAIEKRAPKFWQYVEGKVEFAKANKGLCQTILGDILEVRDRTKANTQGINYVIQSATSIMLGDGFYNIWYQNYKRGLQPSAKAWIHDSITLTIPIKYTHHYYLSFYVDYYDYIYDKYGIHYSQSPKYKFNMRDEMPLKIDRKTGIVTLEGHKHDVEKYIDIMNIKPKELIKTKDSEYIFKDKIKRGRYEMFINNNFNSYEQYRLTYQLELDYLKEVEDNLRNNVFEY